MILAPVLVSALHPLVGWLAGGEKEVKSFLSFPGPGVAARRSGERPERFGERPARLNFLCLLSIADTWEQQEGWAVTAATPAAAGLSCSRPAMAAISSMLSSPAAMTASDMDDGSRLRKRH